MPKRIECTEQNSGSTFDPSGALPTRKGLTCIATVAAELQAIASGAGMDITALLLGKATVDARIQISRLITEVPNPRQ